MTSAMEVYEWNTNPPTKYFAYVSIKHPEDAKLPLYISATLTTWTGEHLGSAILGKPYTSYGVAISQRRSIHVKGTNGKTYHGTYYQSSGDYARITMHKGQ
jgi:hypothetical protein